MTGWISTRDALPSNSRDVLVCRESRKTGYRSVTISYYLGSVKRWYVGKIFRVTHWMESPDLPARDRRLFSDDE